MYLQNKTQWKILKNSHSKKKIKNKTLWCFCQLPKVKDQLFDHLIKIKKVWMLLQSWFWRINITPPIYKNSWISQCIFYLRTPFNFHKSLNKPVIPPYILILKQITEPANIIYLRTPSNVNESLNQRVLPSNTLLLTKVALSPVRRGEEVSMYL